jgi:hypothetical protein
LILTTIKFKRRRRQNWVYILKREANIIRARGALKPGRKKVRLSFFNRWLLCAAAAAAVRSKEEEIEERKKERKKGGY